MTPQYVSESYVTHLKDPNDMFGLKKHLQVVNLTNVTVVSLRIFFKVLLNTPCPYFRMSLNHLPAFLVVPRRHKGRQVLIQSNVECNALKAS